MKYPTKQRASSHGCKNIISNLQHCPWSPNAPSDIHFFWLIRLFWVSTVHCCSAPIHPLSEGSVLGLSNTQVNSRRHNGRASLTSSLMPVWYAKSFSACLKGTLQSKRTGCCLFCIHGFSWGIAEGSDLYSCNVKTSLKSWWLVWRHSLRVHTVFILMWTERFDTPTVFI